MQSVKKYKKTKNKRTFLQKCGIINQKASNDFS